jgi:hypothetical protein
MQWVTVQLIFIGLQVMSRVTRKVNKILPNFLKKWPNNAKIFFNKVCLKAQNHSHQTTFGTLIYLQQKCDENAYLR